MNDFIGSGGYNNNEPTQQQINAKKWMKIITVIIVLLLLISIGLFALIYYIQATELKITLDGESTSKLKDVLIFENNELYIPIRAISSYLGYNSGNGEYKQYAEDTTKCYVESADEIASFTLGSNKIYKIVLDGNNDYEYYEIEEPIKMINNQLCTTIEGAQIAFNVAISYNKEKNSVDIYKLPFLVKYYTKEFQNSAIAEEDAEFCNQKALLYNMIIVKNSNNNYGVYNLKGKEILGTKYKNIKFIESTKEFIVTTMEGKMGIMSYDAKTKISPDYDEIKQIDKDLGLYLVTNNKKQGVVNSNGSIVIYPEYDQIGINASNFTGNQIKNQYVLYNKCIPVKKDNVWEIYDKTGKKIVDNTYENLGCSSVGENQKNTNSVLLIPDYEGIVVQKNGYYGIIDSNGTQLIPNSLQSVYSITSEGKEVYHMIYVDRTGSALDGNIVEYIKEIKSTNNESSTTETNNENTAEENNQSGSEEQNNVNNSNN